MMTVEDILKAPQVAELIKQHSQIEKRVETAADLLKEVEQPIAAVLEVARAHIDEKIHIFFSYKKQDAPSAKLIVEQLRKDSAGKFEIVFAGDFDKNIPGEEWNKEIRKGIKNAHWFFLLLPDPSVAWDWCLFETGMFRGEMIEGANRLFCLHHPDQPDLPPQIKEFQAIPAEDKPVQDMLTKIYIEENPVPGMDAINPHLKDDIPKIANIIIEAIKPPTSEIELKLYPKSVKIKIDIPHDDDPDKKKGKLNDFLKKPEELNSATIVAIDDDTKLMFGKSRNAKPATWGELIDEVSQKGSDIRWLNQLRDSLREAAKDNIFPPIQSLFQGKDAGKIWHPLLIGANKTLSNVIVSFVIVFVEAISAGSTAHIPTHIQALITTLKYVYRFRWEVIERFKDGISKEEVDEFKDILEQQENEAQSRGLMDPTELCKNFKESEAKQIMEMYEKWYALRNNKNGELDIAIEKKDAKKIQDILVVLAEMNQKFIELASNRLEKISTT
jgi:hypothetical protein